MKENNLKSILNNDETKQYYLDSVRPEFKEEALSDEFLDKVATGGGRWFLSDDTTVGVCDDCKKYTFKKEITGEYCDECGKPFKHIIYAKDLPDDYDMNL